MDPYTRLFRGIVHSTVWREADHVRIVWVTMLALADSRGEVAASVPGLADVSRVTVDQCRDALARLGSPDSDSRCRDEEGRRIVTIDGGWRLVNHDKYRSLGGPPTDATERRAWAAARKRRRRRRAECPRMSQDVPTVPTPAPSSLKRREEQEPCGVDDDDDLDVRLPDGSSRDAIKQFLDDELQIGGGRAYRLANNPLMTAAIARDAARDGLGRNIENPGGYYGNLVSDALAAAKRRHRAEQEAALAAQRTDLEAAALRVSIMSDEELRPVMESRGSLRNLDPDFVRCDPAFRTEAARALLNAETP